MSLEAHFTWNGSPCEPYFFGNEAGKAVTIDGAYYRVMLCDFVFPVITNMAWLTSGSYRMSNNIPRFNDATPHDVRSKHHIKKRRFGLVAERI